jgi:hypothetical protein
MKRKRFRRRSYPSRRYRAFRRGKAPIAVLPLLTGVVAPIAIAMKREGDFLYNFKVDPTGATLGLVNQIVRQYTGFGLRGEPFDYMLPLTTYAGLGAGVVGHKLANKFGINAQMKKIPLVGKFVQL